MGKRLFFGVSARLIIRPPWTTTLGVNLGVAYAWD